MEVDPKLLKAWNNLDEYARSKIQMVVITVIVKVLIQRKLELKQTLFFKSWEDKYRWKD